MICFSCPIERCLDTSDRVIIQGFKDHTGKRKWIVDLLTIDAEGHGNTERLTESMLLAAEQTGTKDELTRGDCAALAVDD